MLGNENSALDALVLFAIVNDAWSCAKFLFAFEIDAFAVALIHVRDAGGEISSFWCMTRLWTLRSQMPRSRMHMAILRTLLSMQSARHRPKCESLMG